MEANIYLSRMNKMREQLEYADMDVFFIGPSTNMVYFTGYERIADERLNLFVLPVKGQPFLLENILYKEQTKELPVRDQVFWKDGDDSFSILAAELKKRDVLPKKAAVEPQIPALFTLPLAETFSETRFSLGSFLTDPLRNIKDPAELTIIRCACQKSDQALTAIIERGSWWTGKTELELCDSLNAEFRMRGLGSFGASVQSGANAAIPHYNTGNTVIEKGKCLLIDFWGRLDGYYTDCTRTFYFDRPDREFTDIYNIVLEAHLAAESRARPGNTLADVDFAARSIIEKHGYGEYFTHRTGHGLGIDIHEGLSVNRDMQVPIQPGMVFSIEPGIYLPGRFGVRIENLVAIGETGPEVLHHFSRELTIIE